MAVSAPGWWPWACLDRARQFWSWNRRTSAKAWAKSWAMRGSSASPRSAARSTSSSSSCEWITSWRGLVPRSPARTEAATPQPPSTGPIAWSSATNAPSKTTSLKSDSPVIWRNGRTSTPGARMSTITTVIPARLGASGLVRARHRPQSANWAYEVHTLRPCSTQPPSAGSARVRSEARSLPASGSLKSWQNSRSALRMPGSQRRFWASVPWASRQGPTRLTAMRPTNSGARARANSSCTM